MRERAFIYGDLLFESIRIRGGHICFADKHYKRLLKSAALLKFDPGFFTEDLFKESIMQALNGAADARARFVLYRNSNGFYTPEQNGVKWETAIFPLDLQAHTCADLGVFSTYKKPCNELSNIKSGNALISVLAGLYAKENGLSDCLLLNEQGRVAEATSSNLFLWRNNQLITPPLSEGCVAGVMREAVKETCGVQGIVCHERPVGPDDLLDADEVFLTNAIQGIVPVLSYRGRHYQAGFSEKIRAAMMQ